MNFRRLLLAILLVFVMYEYVWLTWGVRSPEALKRRYGLEQARSGVVKISGTEVQAIVVPVLLEAGLIEFVIPQQDTEYPLYWRDRAGLAPVFLARGSLRRDVFLSYTAEAVRQRVTVSRGGNRTSEREMWIVAPGTGRPRNPGFKVGNIPSDAAALVYDLAAER